MNIRQAILAAAADIERSSNLYDFGQISVPSDDSPGCLLGRMFRHLGHEAGEEIYLATHGILGISTQTFFDRVHNLRFPGWTTTPSMAARAFRAYADKYHPEPRAGIPASVMKIFSMTQEEIRAEFAKAE